MALRRVVLTLVALATVVVPAPRASADAVSFQADAAHTGYVDAAVKPPLGRKWIRRDIAVQGYPLVADGRVFVATESTIQALDVTTGQTLWSRGSGAATLAYGHGRLFATAEDAVTAIDPATGATIWTEPDSDASGSIVVGDLVIVSSYYGGLSALRWQDGIQVWNAYAPGAGTGIPASDGQRVFTTSGCAETSAVHAALGVELWHYTGSCTGGGGGTPRTAGGLVFAPDSRLGRCSMPAPGPCGRRSRSRTPAPRSPATARSSHSRTSCEPTIDNATIAWRVPSGDHPFAGPPLVVGDVVYVQTEPHVLAVSRSTGVGPGPARARHRPTSRRDHSQRRAVS